MSLLSLKHLQDEQAAYDWVEAQLWPNGPVCPDCEGTERISDDGRARARALAITSATSAAKSST